jgi:predicted dehydrogenase
VSLRRIAANPVAPEHPRLRGAIVGVGNVAVHGHLPGWLARPEVRIAAVADTDPARRAMAASLLPGVPLYASAEALMAAEALDFVDVCTPPASHAGLIQAALERDVHVLCEKPLVSSPGALAALAALAAQRARVLHTVHNWHHAPVVARTSALVAAGAVGPVERITWETLRLRPAAAGDPRGGNWRVDPDVAGGGVLTDHGWHVFYVIARWMGSAIPIAVTAALERRRHRQWAVEDTARVAIGFPGATAEVLLTWAADERRNRAEVRGRDGVLRLEDDALVLERAGAEERWSCPPGLSAGSHHPEWFHGVAEEFLAAVTGRAPREGNLAEASLCVALEALARESSRRGAQPLPVQLPPGAAVRAARESVA